MAYHIISKVVIESTSLHMLHYQKSRKLYSKKKSRKLTFNEVLIKEIPINIL
jgi:hypothetical protein